MLSLENSTKKTIRNVADCQYNATAVHSQQISTVFPFSKEYKLQAANNINFHLDSIIFWVVEWVAFFKRIHFLRTVPFISVSPGNCTIHFNQSRQLNFGLSMPLTKRELS